MSANGRPPGDGLIPAILSGLTVAHHEGRPVRSDPHGGGHDAPLHEAPGHETEDVNVRNTAVVMGGLMLTALAAVGVMVWLMHTVARDQRAALPRLTPQQTARLAPPPPNLQSNPFADLDRERTAQEERLDGYAYLDDGRTRARIPLDRAMTLTVGRPLDP